MVGDTVEHFGDLLPWSLGRPLDVYGLQIPAPMDAHRGFHELMERVHDASGHLFIPLLALYIAGAVTQDGRDRHFPANPVRVDATNLSVVCSAVSSAVVGTGSEPERHVQ